MKKNLKNLYMDEAEIKDRAQQYAEMFPDNYQSAYDEMVASCNRYNKSIDIYMKGENK